MRVKAVKKDFVRTNAWLKGRENWSEGSSGTEKKEEKKYINFTIVFRTPWCRVNVNVIRIQAQGSSLNLIRDCSIQHPNTTDASIVCNSNAAKFVECLSCYFSCTSGPMFVIIIILRRWITVIVVYVWTGTWIVVENKIWVIRLDSIVQNRDNNTLPRISFGPGTSHVHVISSSGPIVL